MDTPGKGGDDGVWHMESAHPPSIDVSMCYSWSKPEPYYLTAHCTDCWLWARVQCPTYSIRRHWYEAVLVLHSLHWFLLSVSWSHFNWGVLRSYGMNDT